MRRCLILATAIAFSACGVATGPGPRAGVDSLTDPAAEGEKVLRASLDPEAVVATALDSASPRRSIGGIELGKPMLPKPRLPITREVRRELTRFVSHDRGFITASLLEREKYYEHMVSIFRDEGVPTELMNVALIESKFRSDAGSSAGAVGIWQFMKTTAAMYGLKVGRRGGRDERKDPILSTIAAARHLRDLYEELGDWFLALAAYNAGLGRISRAVAASKHNDFWRLARSGRIAKQTADYVPRFIAVTLILNDLEKYGFPGEARAVG